MYLTHGLPASAGRWRKERVAHCAEYCYKNTDRSESRPDSGLNELMTQKTNFAWFTRSVWQIVALSLFLLSSASAATEVKNVRAGVTEERTRLVLDLSGKVDFKIFSLDNPRRVVVDFPAMSWPSDGPSLKDKGLVGNIRFGHFTDTQSRLVVDLKKPAIVGKAFTLAPASNLPHRFVIDLVETSGEKFAAQVARDRAAKQRVATPKAAPEPEIKTPTKKREAGRKPVIVLDAGHGGVDPGAQGRKAREKNVTLAFARELARQLRNTGKYQVFLTRNRDIYIPLRQRVTIARKHDADLFISIHADAIKRKSVRGMSIYTLSETASDKEAADLARKQNQSDIIAGIDFHDQPPEVANILIDLAQRETKNLSVEFANIVVDKARGATRLLDRTHRFAGFRVLKAPDVPSVLIELGFLTNRSDEKQLVSASWRRKLATRLVKSVDTYFSVDRLALLAQ
jgi:N-acetylmuramoyl-L-alanine amidase